MTTWRNGLALLGLVAVLAGMVLLPLSLVADLRSHAHSDHELLEQLPPRAAALVEEAQAQEEANPWHDALIAGAALLICGLATLYATERARRRELEAVGEEDISRVRRQAGAIKALNAE